MLLPCDDALSPLRARCKRHFRRDALRRPLRQPRRDYISWRDDAIAISKLHAKLCPIYYQRRVPLLRYHHAFPRHGYYGAGTIMLITWPSTTRHAFMIQEFPLFDEHHQHRMIYTPMNRILLSRLCHHEYQPATRHDDADSSITFHGNTAARPADDEAIIE